VPEPVDAWWERRQRSKGVAVPYGVGEFRSDWERYPTLVRQYHPDLNHGITLTQVPPAADVWLLWQCEVGHLFAATPWEQRMRPGQSRRRSTWCPECAEGAVIRTPRPAGWRPPEAPVKSKARAMCSKSDAAARAPGEAFASACAPARASAAEADLHQRLAQRLEFTPDATAVRTRTPFFTHLEVWPDIVIPELQVAIEYDTIGRHGLEHVGQRETIDQRKDRLLRAVGWEVIRVRTGKLHTLGPHDVNGGISSKLIDRILDQLREARGPLFVDCYLR
jgi:very-short-patch-repair endonuclease